MFKYFLSKAFLENLVFVWLGFGLIFTLAGNQIVLPEWLQVMGRLHPMVLHFPIVLLLMAVVLSFIPKNENTSPIKELLDYIWLFGLNFAGIAVLAGLILSQEDYSGDILDLHKWSGWAVFLISTGLYFISNLSKSLYKIGTLTLTLVILLAGHWGASLTHGEDFLLAPILKETQSQPFLADAEVFRDVVQPILQSKCLSCHKEGKTKGDLRLDHLDGIRKGGKTGPFILAGNTEKSLLTQRIHLPLEEKEHMPPKEKAQLTDEEIEILTEWVKSGGSLDQKLVELPSDEPLFELVSHRFEPATSYDFEFADQSVISSLNNHYRRVEPLYPESPALIVSYFGISAFEPSSLEDLRIIQDQMIQLNLDKMPLKGLDLGFLQNFKNLSTLRLNFTDLEESQILQIGKIQSLTSLSLAGVKLSEGSIKALQGLENLQNLYLWQSGINQDQQNLLQSSLPQVNIDFGFDDTAVIYPLNPPQIKQDKTLFEDSLEITLSHPIKNVEVYYTLDGTMPDSLAGSLYQKPIWVKSSGKILAKAYSKGWISSPANSAVFMKSGSSPLGYRLLTSPSPNYKGSGATTLFDRVKGKNNHTSGEWLGYTSGPASIEIDLDESKGFESIGISLLYHESAYIFPPERVEIDIFENGIWKKSVSEKPIQSTQILEIRSELLTYSLKENSPQKIRIKLHPIKSLPGWHPGAGAPGWVFVDEILLN
ncbi:MAG: c-type cytochrome domain-containing protein [Bacteroidota bacterium]